MTISNTIDITHNSDDTKGNNGSDTNENNDIFSGEDKDIIVKKKDILLLNLKNIAELKANEKLLNDDSLIKIDQRYFQMFRRWCTADNRNSSIKKIETIIYETFDYIDQLFVNEQLPDNNNNKINSNLFYDDNSQQMHSFLLCINNAANGLKNLKITYHDDINIQTQIDLLIEKLSDRATKMNKILKISV